MDEPASKQAFSKARYKISYTGFKALNEQVLEEWYTGSSEGLWKDYRIFGIDGSTLRLPDSEETVEYFGRQENRRDPNDRLPVLARISEVVDLTSGMVVSAEIGPYIFSERNFAEEQITQVCTAFHKMGQERLLFVFDRGYPSKELIKKLCGIKADFIIRCKQKFNTKIDEIHSAGVVDEKIRLYEELPDFRVIARPLPSGERCVLLTTLTDAEAFTSEEINQVYWLRWTGNEEGYKKQKITLEMENFSGKGIEAVLQEFYATLLAVNLFQVYCLDHEGAWNIESPPDKRINRSIIFGSLRDSLLKTLTGEMIESTFLDKFRRLADRFTEPIRTGRHFLRKGVKKPKSYHVYRRVC